MVEIEERIEDQRDWVRVTMVESSDYIPVSESVSVLPVVESTAPKIRTSNQMCIIKNCGVTSRTACNEIVRFRRCGNFGGRDAYIAMMREKSGKVVASEAKAPNL